MSKARPDSALAGEQSPFLLHGATQPVDWLPWGDEAFARARAEDRPILLDIGAVWCHWCHVMDHESYEDADTAALINAHFIPVKVDRDERPDVDARYQRAVQLLTGQGGWPLTAFLTPEGEVFYGGTYFPPRDAHGRPSFRRVLTELARVWREERARALEGAEGIREKLREIAAAEASPAALDPNLPQVLLEELAHSFDFRYGGFGRAPKFPNAGALDLLLDAVLDRDVEWARRVLEDTLHAMARGGIYDQIGGGFHRYATDARWLVPHFEKMAYDNGVLLATYARTFAAFGGDEYRAAAEGIIAHYEDVAPTLLQQGGFPASQDADFGFDNDGDYWTWTRAELSAALGGDEQLTRAALLRFGFDDDGGAMHLDPSRRVLFRKRTAEQVARELAVDADRARALIATASQQLKQTRDARPRPFVDETLYSGWVALVSSGHLAAARYLPHDGARDAALRALERIERERDTVHGVPHRLGDRAAGHTLEDQAFTAQAYVDAFEVTQSPVWLERAQELVNVMLEQYRDPATNAFADRPRGAPAPVAALQEDYFPIADAPSPSGNATAALTLLRLHALTNRSEYRTHAENVLRAFGGTAPRLGSAAATYVKALEWALGPVTTIVVAGSADGTGAELLQAALAAYRPRSVVRWMDVAALDPATLPPELAAMVSAAVPRAYVCAGRTCAAPVDNATALTDVLRTLRG